MKTKIKKQSQKYIPMVVMISIAAMLFTACVPAPQASPSPTNTVENTPITEATTPPTSGSEEPVPTRELPPKIRDITPLSPIYGDLEKMTPIAPENIPSHLQPVAEQAIAKLAEELEIEESEIAILSIKAVTWSDSSLGCPEPGMNYLQVLTPGYHVLLSALDGFYSYNANKMGYGLICENPNPPYSDANSE